MLLRQKIALIMGAAVVLMVALNVAVLLPIADSFSQLEEEQAERNAIRVEQDIEDRLESLTRTAWDWSHWDETYEFIAGERPGFVADNLSASALATIGVDLMVFYDGDGGIAWSGAFDPATGAPIALSQFAAGGIAPGDPLLQNTARLSSTRGVMATDAGPMLVASVPIVPTEDTAPANGTLIIGRLLDPGLLAQMGRQLRVDFDLLPVDPAMLADASRRYEIVARDSEQISGRLVIDDLYGEPIAAIVNRTPREITAVGDRSIGVSVLSIAIIGLVDLAVVWVLLRRLVLRPLAGVTEQVAQIGETGDLDRRVPVASDGGDECARLGQQFNRMLDRLADARRNLLDQTQRAERARVEAEQANEAKTAFLTNMSHELRTPLNAVIGFSDLMLQGALGPIGNPKYREYIGDISASGHHLLELINSILHLAQASRGTLVLHESAFAVAEVIRGAVRLVLPQAAAGQVVIVQEIPGDLGRLYADRTKVSQILLNLLSNAVKFTPPHGKVTIGAAIGRDGRLSIRVGDTGIGIRREDIAEALKPFVQVRADDQLREGAGLGLPLAVALAELHGGGLDLQSTLGVGTTVTVTFPPDRVLGPEVMQSAG